MCDDPRAHYVVLLREAPLPPLASTAYESAAIVAAESARRLVAYKAIARELHGSVSDAAATPPSPSRRRRRGPGRLHAAEKTRLHVCSDPFAFTDDVNSGAIAAVAPPPANDAHFRIACVVGPLPQEWQAARICKRWSAAASSRGVAARTSLGDDLAAEARLPFYVDPIVSFELQPAKRRAVEADQTDDADSDDDDDDDSGSGGARSI